jgi:hypothetical protein
VLAVFALEDRRKQPDQRGPTDRRPHIVPRTVTGDSHVDIAAERRIPQMHGRQSFAGGTRVRSTPDGSGDSLKVLIAFEALIGGPPLLRHCLP